MNLGGPEVLIVLVVVLVLFGSSQLPKLARSIGQAQKEFKKGLAEGVDADAPTDVDVPPAATTTEEAAPAGGDTPPEGDATTQT